MSPTDSADEAKFATSFPEAKLAVRTFLMEGIKKEQALLGRLESACKESPYPNIDAYLDKAVYADFKAIVVIDEARPELNRVVKNINADISIIELHAFVSDNGDRIFHFDTLYDESEDIDTSEVKDEDPEQEAARRAARRLRRANADTIVVPAWDETFQDTFLGGNEWRAVKIGPPMKDRIKYIAAYRVAPISAVTHLATVKEIKPYEDTGKYQLIFDGPAQEIKHVPLKEGSHAPQGSFYVQKDKLLAANTLDDALA